MPSIPVFPRPGLSPFWMVVLCLSPALFFLSLSRKLDAIVNQLKPCRNMPCHRATHTRNEHTLRPAVTDRDGGIPACMHAHLPGNYSWTREPVGFCRLRVEPSCHVRGSCPDATHTLPVPPWSATSKPCVCSRLDFTDPWVGPLCLALTREGGNWLACQHVTELSCEESGSRHGSHTCPRCRAVQ